MVIKMKVLRENAICPTAGSSFAAGQDLYACLDEPVYIGPHETVKIPTGLAFELPTGTFGAIVARSGLATKEGLRPANCIGICDSDYRGEYIVALHNDTDYERRVKPGERIAQLIVMEYPQIIIEEVEELSSTERGTGGFGSTGK